MGVPTSGTESFWQNSTFLVGGLRISGTVAIPGTTGSVFFVDSVTGTTLNDGKTPQTPVSKLDLAIGLCTANKGDIIYIMPGHAETIAANTELLFDVAGITIIGLGRGAARPTFTLTTANTNRIPVSAGSIAIRNCIFIGNFLSIATCFLLTTANDFTVEMCAFRDTDATHGFLSIITTTVSVNSDGLVFTNNEVQSDATTTPGPTIVVANTLDRLTIANNNVVHSTISNNVSALLAHGALVVTHLVMTDNYVYSVNTDTSGGGILITTSATTGSGLVARNVARTLDTAAVILVTVAAVQYTMYDNKHVDGATFTSGYLLPAIGAD